VAGKCVKTTTSATVAKRSAKKNVITRVEMLNAGTNFVKKHLFIVDTVSLRRGLCRLGSAFR
jgi:hypothetical protein